MSKIIKLLGDLWMLCSILMFLGLPVILILLGLSSYLKHIN